MWCPKCNNGLAVEVTDKEVILKCFICGNRILFLPSDNRTTIKESIFREYTCIRCNIEIKSKVPVKYCKKCKKIVRKEKMIKNYRAYRERNNLPIYNQ